MSYNVYTCEYIGQPNHVAFLITTNEAVLAEGIITP